MHLFLTPGPPPGKRLLLLASLFFSASLPQYDPMPLAHLFMVVTALAAGSGAPANRVCHRLFAAKDAARAKYLLCFQRGTLLQFDFSSSPLASGKAAPIPLEAKECHTTRPPLKRSYAEVSKTTRAGKWEIRLEKISARFTDEAYRRDDFVVRQDNAAILDGSSALDSLGPGWCFWREKPLSEQAKDENCVNALACSELSPETCNCTW